MKSAYLPLSALIIAALVCLGCGGGSVGPPPPGTVPPTITGVSPLVVDADSQVTFAATTSGSAITSWTWTFGGAATPSTSRGISPTVTTTTPGTYDCKVEGQNAWYQTTTTFKLTVK